MTKIFDFYISEVGSEESAVMFSVAIEYENGTITLPEDFEQMVVNKLENKNHD